MVCTQRRSLISPQIVITSLIRELWRTVSKLYRIFQFKNLKTRRGTCKNAQTLLSSNSKMIKSKILWYLGRSINLVLNMLRTEITYLQVRTTKAPQSICQLRNIKGGRQHSIYRTTTNRTTSKCLFNNNWHKVCSKTNKQLVCILIIKASTPTHNSKSKQNYYNNFLKGKILVILLSSNSNVCVCLGGQVKTAKGK